MRVLGMNTIIFTLLAVLLINMMIVMMMMMTTTMKMMIPMGCWWLLCGHCQCHYDGDSEGHHNKRSNPLGVLRKSIVRRRGLLEISVLCKEGRMERKLLHNITFLALFYKDNSSLRWCDPRPHLRIRSRCLNDEAIINSPISFTKPYQERVDSDPLCSFKQLKCFSRITQRNNSCNEIKGQRLTNSLQIPMVTLKSKNKIIHGVPG